MPISQPKYHSVRVPVLVFIVIVIGITLAGFLYYSRQQDQFIDGIRAHLEAVVSLKVAQIDNWRKERLGDARAIAENPLLGHEVSRYFNDPDGSSGTAIKAWMQSMMKSYDYHSIVLVDTNLAVREMVGIGKPAIGTNAMAMLRRTMDEGRIFFQDFHRAAPVDVMHIDIDVPLMLPVSGGESRPIGAVLIRIDPGFLNSFMQAWPTRSETAETLLVRQDGDSVVFLTQLRFYKMATFDYRLPITMKELVSVKAVLEEEGTFSGVDYRGENVIFASGKVPRSSWFVVAKIDRAEAMAPFHERLTLISGLGLGLGVIGALLLVGWWRGQQAGFFRSQYENEMEKQALVRHYEYLTRYANDIILLAGPDERIVEANERAVQAYGYSREELLQFKAPALRAPEVRDDFLQRLVEDESEKGLVYETVHIRKNGEKFPVEVSVRRIDVEGTVYYQRIIRDVTERKRADEKIRRSADKYRHLFNSGSDAVFVHLGPSGGLPGRFVEVNDIACRRLGYTRDELLRMSPVDIDAPDTLPEIPKRIVELEAKGHAVWEGAHMTKDGRRIPVEISNTIFEFNGVKTILSNVHDITERKKAENKIVRLNRLYAVLCQINETIMRARDRENLFAEICRMAVEHGKFRLAWVGLCDFDARVVKPVVHAGADDDYLKDINVSMNDQPEGRGPTGTAIREGRIVVCSDISSDLRMQPWGKKAQKYGYRSSAAVPFKSRGRIIGSVNVYAAAPDFFDDEEIKLLAEMGTDISFAIDMLENETQRKRYEDDLLKTNMQLSDALSEIKKMQSKVIIQERLSALGQMVTGITHDFNNVLMPIRGLSDYLLSNPELLNDRQETMGLIQSISSASKDASEIVKRLREFYHPDDDLVVASVDLPKLISDVALMTEPRWKIQSQAEGRAITVDLKCSVMQNVMVNESQIREVLVNLILNAVDAMPRGGSITLSCDMLADGKSVELRVRDTGAGMSEDVRRKCLDPFFTTKGKKGTGMGLAMVHGIVTRHGGGIDVDSAVGKGTAIIITLPVTAEIAVQKQEKKPGKQFQALRKLNILVVDDEEWTRKLLVRFLKSDGHTVQAVNGGKEGIRSFPGGGFDLVLTDRAMPDISGDEVAKAIKAVSPDVPIIQLTGFADLMKQEGEQPQGVDHILGKPTTQNDLRHAIAIVMGWTNGESAA